MMALLEPLGGPPVKGRLDAVMTLTAPNDNVTVSQCSSGPVSQSPPLPPPLMTVPLGLNFWPRPGIVWQRT